MAQPSRTPVRARREGMGASVAALALLGLAAVCVAFPILSIAWGAARGGATSSGGGLTGFLFLQPGAAVLLSRTAGYSLVIGILAAALAWPAAWAVRARRDWWVWLIAPMLLPGYLAYAGWGLLRSPGTLTGDILAGAGPPPWSGLPGYWSLAAGRALAVGGLSLWAWPLAAIILAHGASRLDAAVLDALRLEAGSAWRRRLTILAMMRGPATLAILAVALVMTGSAVPLHLAQIQTYAIQLWLQLDQTPAHRRWEVWASSWPLLLIALGAAAAATSRMAPAQNASPEPAAHPLRISRPSALAGAAVWAMSVVVPAVLFGVFVPGLGALRTFWRVHHSPVLASLALAGAVAAIGAGMAIAAWGALACGGRWRWAVNSALAAFVFAGLAPGILMGSAISGAWNAWGLARWIGDSSVIILLGHIARFGFVPLLVGSYLAQTEPRAERDSRRLDGADGLLGWAWASLPGGLATAVGAGVAAGVLAFHEIEAAVVLQPPGLESFPRQMLQFLHYAWTQELCAGALLVILVGLAGAVVVGVLGRLGPARGC